MTALKTFTHRIKRIYQSYFPKPLTKAEHDFVKSTLDPKLASLFYEQPLSDQRHAFLVYQKSLKVFDNKENAPSSEEQFLAACFHDLAKKDSFKSTSLRIIAAFTSDFLPRATLEKLRTSKYSFLQKIWVYANHSELSLEMIEPHIDSNFVKFATLYHHNPNFEYKDDKNLEKNVKIFIQADTL